jgi:thioredoxin-like negative regulator of GroEL
MKKVIYLSASWCGPCKSFRPILQKVTSDLGIPVEYVDVDLNPTFAENFGIRSVPTTVYMNGETILFKYSGAMTEAQLRNNLM